MNEESGKRTAESETKRDICKIILTVEHVSYIILFK